MIRETHQPESTKLPLLIAVISLFLAVSGRAFAQGNLLQNPSMESWHSSGLRADQWGVWTPQPLRHTWSVHRERELVRDGLSAMRVDVGDWVNVYQGLTVTGGQEYTHGCYVYATDGGRVSVFFGMGKHGNSEMQVYELEPKVWTRVHTTTTIPADTTAVVAYMNVQGRGSYVFDAGMANAGGLEDFVPRATARKLAPPGRIVLPDEVAMTPRAWDGGGAVLAEQEVGFAFDQDPMSIYKSSLPTTNLPKHIGAEFAEATVIRGIAVLFATEELPAGMRMQIAIRDGAGEWTVQPHTLVRVGAIRLLSIPHSRATAVRLDLLADEGTEIAAPDICHMVVPQ